jgi:hypothetical protein
MSNSSHTVMLDRVSISCQPSFILASAYSARVALFHSTDMPSVDGGYFSQNAEIILLHIRSGTHGD